jgi:23S rRNA pseudouridine1911/1915/1917 synthase
MTPILDVVPKVLFEDDSLLVLDKPAGLVVHPAPSHHGPTLIDWLKDYLGPGASELFAEPERLGLVHRLDKDTSGVLVVTKTAAAKTEVGRQFHDRLVKKEYVAFIEGIPPRNRGIISAPVGRSRKTPSRMAVTGTGRPSETSFEVAEKFKEVSLVNLYPKTGRTHQLRVHCAAIGHPIVGDRTYGSKVMWAENYGILRPLLHARRIEVVHPVTGKRVPFEAPWPADMKKALTVFRRSAKAVLVVAALLGGLVYARAEDSGNGSATTATKHKATSPSSNPSAKSLRHEMSSLHEQFKSLIVEVSALQDRVSAIQSNLDALEADRRLRDLEKALSDLNGKAVGGSNVAEETKSQVLDLSRKLKEHQDTLDQLRDQVDHLHQELIETKARTEAPPAPAPNGQTK